MFSFCFFFHESNGKFAFPIFFLSATLLNFSSITEYKTPSNQMCRNDYWIRIWNIFSASIISTTSSGHKLTKLKCKTLWRAIANDFITSLRWWMRNFFSLCVYDTTKNISLTPTCIHKHMFNFIPHTNMESSHQNILCVALGFQRFQATLCLFFPLIFMCTWLIILKTKKINKTKGKIRASFIKYFRRGDAGLRERNKNH